ncbi:MAG: hypothetical protein U0694_18195 [Anaerolineae bacterium]
MFALRFTAILAFTLLLLLSLGAALMHIISALSRTDEIAFVRTDTRDIYTLDVGSGITLPLLKGASAAAWLGWSRDGSLLAFTSGDDRLRILNVTDGSLRDYSVGGGLFFMQEPAWSPDSRYIAFHAQANTSSFHIYLLRLADGAIFPLREQTATAVGAAWSPVSANGTMTLAFQALESSCGTDLYVLQITETSDGTPQDSDARRLTACGYQNMRPEWSPDGQRLLFYASSLAEGQRLSPPNIYTLDVASGTRQQLTTMGSTYYPTWSADGRQIAFTTLALAQTCRVYLMDANGDHLHCLSHDATIDVYLAWRP